METKLNVENKKTLKNRFDVSTVNTAYVQEHIKTNKFKEHC
jgi:hypothetical protein